MKYLEDLSYKLEYIHEKNFVFRKAPTASEQHWVENSRQFHSKWIVSSNLYQIFNL